MGWFKRSKKGVVTPTNEKKETPEGLWFKCPDCNTVVSNEEFIENLNVCANCSYHGRIDSKTYFKILFDDNKYNATRCNKSSPAFTKRLWVLSLLKIKAIEINKQHER